MAFGNDDFMNFMGYRNMILEDKIEECLAAARQGEKSIRIDAGDLTEQEAEYLQAEVRRRIEGGGY